MNSGGNTRSRIAADRRGVVVVLTHTSRSIECVIARTALETHFWLTPNADDTSRKNHPRQIRSHIRRRKRKLLANPRLRLELTAVDFTRN
nr:DUF1488 family protein [Caballeronia terrestris]